MIEIILIDRLKSAIKFLYEEDISENLIQIQKTRSEFDGDITVVVFPFL